MGEKITYSRVKVSFEKEGCTLLANEYKSNSTKLDYICPKGHEANITWISWNRGGRCYKCRNEFLKNDFYSINKSFKDEGYILHETTYINSKHKMEYSCPKGHKYKISWNMWQQGHRCPYCSGSMTHIEDIINEFAKEKYVVTSNKYKFPNKIKFICINGHEGSMSLSNWRYGKRCAICSGNSKKVIEDVKKNVEEYGYVLVSDNYTNAHIKLNIICPKGHGFKSSWHNWASGKRCPICPSQKSNFEKEVGGFLQESGYCNFITKDRTLLINPETNRSLELDIFFPELNKAIECNGDYWHSKGEVVNRDLIKSYLCEQKGIDLLTVSDSLWKNNKDLTKNNIKIFLGANN